MVTIFRGLFDKGNHKKALINKISWIIFSPIGKIFTVAYKVPRSEMIRLYLNIEDSLHFFFFFSFDSLHSNLISSSVGIKDALRFN